MNDGYGRPWGHPQYGHPAGAATYGMPGQTGIGITPGNPIQGGAAINMPDRAQMGGHGGGLPPWQRVPIYPPQILLSTNKYVGHETRYYGAGILNIAANTQTTATVQFDTPCIIFAMTGAAFDTQAGALPIGTAALDTFIIALEHSNGNRLTTTARLGSTILGTAAQPGLIGGNGWVFDRGSTMVMLITPLRANMRIDVNLLCVEERGPSNLTNRG
jgi:hypothetical protein